MFVTKPEFRRFGDHARAFFDAHMLCELGLMRVCRRIHHQARLCHGAILKSSGKGPLAGALDEKMKNDLGERGIQGMAVALPIARLAVDLDISSLFAGLFKVDDCTFEVRPRLAVPFPEVVNFKRLSVCRAPFHPVFASEEPGLNFDFTLSHGAFAEVA